MLYELSQTQNSLQNNVALYRCHQAGSIFYKKVALTRQANEIIKTEKMGYDWYFSSTGYKNNVVMHEKYFYEIDIPEFKGKKFSLTSKISGNEHIIEIIVDFYKRVWLTTNKFAIHGDMALSNCIIKEKNIIFLVDWEHFHFTDMAYFGFDIINMLFTSLCYETTSLCALHRTTRRFLKKIIERLIFNIPIISCLCEKPFQNTRAYLENFYSRFNLNKKSMLKFPILKFSREISENIDIQLTEC